MAQKELWNIAKQRMLEESAALLKEEGDLVREFKCNV